MWLKLIIKVILAIISALLAWEVIVSAFIIKTPEFKNDSNIGKVYHSGILVWGKEGYSISKINNLGLRGEDVSPKKDNEFRVLAIGDSYTEALHVFEDKTFHYKLEQELNNKKTTFKFANVVNLGKAGMSPADYIYLADYYNENFKPDYVIVQLNLGDFERDLVNKNSLYYIKKENDALKVFKNDAFISINYFRQKFPQLNFLTSFATVRLASEQVQTMLKLKSSSGKKVEAESIEPEKLVEWTVRNIKDKYENVIILYLPKVEYYTDAKNKYSVYEEAITKYTAKYNVPFIDMRKDYVSYFDKYKQPSHGFDNTQPGRGHINKIGHDLAAKKLISYFKEEVIK